MKNLKLIAAIMITLFLASTLCITNPTKASPTVYYVSNSGSDSNDGLTPGTAWQHIEYAVTQASSGDTIMVAAGTYNEQVIIDKSLTLLGAQHGVDARTRTGTGESIITYSEGPVLIEANDVTIDGFTIEGSTDPSGYVAGIWTNPGYAPLGGYSILNNIIQNNIMGLYANNAGTYPATIRFNVFKNNNLPGPSSGDGIYSDIGLNNATIDSNNFIGDWLTIIGPAAYVAGGAPSVDLTISNNVMTGGGMYFLGTSTLSISSNTIQDTGYSAAAISVSGGNSGVAVTGNTVQDSTGYGIVVDNEYGAGSNVNVRVHYNNIEGNSLGGLLVNASLGGYTGTLEATYNWWNSVIGPTNPGNPGGTGDAVIGNVDFAHWLGAALSGAYPGYVDAIEEAADRLVALQSPTDFGWDWIVTGLAAHSASSSASNLYGVTALDLIGASQKTGNLANLEAAENVGNELMTKNVTNWGVYTGSFPPYQWGFASDYIFMMELAAATGNSIYSTFATAAWAWQKANAQSGRFASASASWNYYITAGLDVGAAAWDSAAWGLATLLLGDTAWSNAMADIIHNNMGTLTTETITGNSGNNYPVLGLGEALEFFEASPYASAKYASDIAEMVATLSALQNSDGSWSQGDPAAEDVQSTAYAVMGLYAAHMWTTAREGADWLISQQQPNGGWLETDSNEYSEVDSECMSALIASVALLTVISAHGSPTPADTTTYFVGTTVTASVNSPVAGPENIEYVCTGWTGTGDVPASGTGTTVTFTLTKDPTLTWNWKTEYLIAPMIWASNVYLEGPCQVGNTFTVTVNLWNQQSWTGDAIMGFDFNLWWYASTNDFTCANHVINNAVPQPFITLESAVFTSPWANYFVVYNGTATGTPPPAVSNGWTGYELAITGEPPSAPLTNVNITLATLTFKINAEPSFPDVFQTPITFNALAAPANVKLSNPDGSPITVFEADNGLFNLQPGTPDANLASTSTLPTDPKTSLPYIIEYKVGDYYTFEVWMTNMSNAYGFDFELCYPSQYLSIDQPKGITISPLFPQPYTTLEESTSTPGQVYVLVQRSTDKPLVCGAAINVANVTFTSIDDNVVADMLIPENSTGTNPVYLNYADQYSLVCGVQTTYLMATWINGVQVYYNGVEYATYPPSWSLTTGTTIGPGLYNWQIEYFWRPIGTTNEYGAWVGTDLNLDGAVNIQDLSALAAEYGQNLGPGTWGYLAHPSYGTIDIYDFVLVAKMFGTGTKSIPWVPSI